MQLKLKRVSVFKCFNVWICEISPLASIKIPIKIQILKNWKIVNWNNFHDAGSTLSTQLLAYTYPQIGRCQTLNWWRLIDNYALHVSIEFQQIVQLVYKLKLFLSKYLLLNFAGKWRFLLLFFWIKYLRRANCNLQVETQLLEKF